MDNLLSSMDALAASNFNASVIQDNKIVFILNDISYRVRMPNQSEHATVQHKKHLQQLAFMAEPGCILKDDLIRQLKENKVLDIDIADKKAKDLIKEYRQYQLVLAQKDSKQLEAIALCNQKMNEIQEELNTLQTNITYLLKPCLQSKLDSFAMEQVALICTEVLEDGEWRVLWADEAQYKASDILLANTAIAQMTWLLVNRGI